MLCLVEMGREVLKGYEVKSLEKNLSLTFISSWAARTAPSRRSLASTVPHFMVLNALFKGTLE